MAANKWLPVTDVALLRPAVVYDLLLKVWHVLAAEILSYAKSSRSSGSDDHPCMSSRLKSFVLLKNVVKVSFVRL